MNGESLKLQLRGSSLPASGGEVIESSDVTRVW